MMKLFVSTLFALVCLPIFATTASQPVSEHVSKSTQLIESYAQRQADLDRIQQGVQEQQEAKTKLPIGLNERVAFSFAKKICMDVKGLKRLKTKGLNIIAPKKCLPVVTEIVLRCIHANNVDFDVKSSKADETQAGVKVGRCVSAALNAAH